MRVVVGSHLNRALTPLCWKINQKIYLKNVREETCSLTLELTQFLNNPQTDFFISLIKAQITSTLYIDQGGYISQQKLIKCLIIMYLIIHDRE